LFQTSCKSRRRKWRCCVVRGSTASIRSNQL